MFVPVLPTLWPAMLWRSRPSGGYHPFAAAQVHYYYFARNALWHSVKALGLTGGEVLVPACHHGVEIEALVDAGARVTFYRVGSHWDVDLDDVEKKIGRDTRALYLTHYAGFPGPARAMRALADRHGLVLIEDCALSLLSADGPQPLGALGNVAVFCLYKSLPVPNGGALVVNGDRSYVFPPPTGAPVASTASHALGSLLQNLELRAGTTGAAVRRLARRLGRGTVKAAHIERVAIGSEQFRRAHVGLGMSALTMRLALSQDFDAIVARRRRNYRYLVQELGDVAPPLVESLADGVCPLFYPLVVKDKTPVMQGLAARGIETVDLWRFFHPACNPSEFPEVARLRDTVLEVPCHQDVSDRAIAHVAASVREVVLACDRPRRVVGAR